MKGLASGIKNIVSFLKFFIRIINTTINHTTKVLKYILAILPKVYTLIATLPTYIQLFATLTIGVSVLYLVIGREKGKTGDS